MDRSQLKIRWLVLFLTCIIMTGSYYCFDNPAALKTQLQSHFSHISPSRYEFLFSLLYTVYSIPNIFLPFFGGFLVDKIGVRIMLLIFCTTIVIGQLLFAVGCSLKDFTTMLIGRVIFGLGGESMGVAQSTVLAAWFKNNELAFALGINLSIARLGSVFNNEISPYIAAKFNVETALYFGVFICGVSLAATLMLVPLDRRTERMIKRAALEQSVGTKVKEEPISLKDVRHFRHSFWLLSFSCLVVYGCVLPFNNVASSLLMERDYFKTPNSECSRCGIGKYADLVNCTKIVSGCPSVPPYSWPLPKLSANCTIVKPEDQMKCATSPPWVDSASIDCDSVAWRDGPMTSHYCKSKKDATEVAATPMSVPYIMSAILSPVLGIIVDRFGMRAALAMIASLTLMVVHSLLAWSNINPYFPLIMQGIAYSVYAASSWPSVPYVVEARHIGTAYGVITAIQNLGLALFPLAVAAVYNSSGGSYIPNAELLFAGFGFFGTVFGIALNIVDYKNGSLLNKPHVATDPLEEDSITENLLDPLASPQ